LKALAEILEHPAA